MRKIDAIDSFASNKNSVIFGEQGGNLMAQVESYKMIKKWWYSFIEKFLNKIFCD